MRGLRIPGRVGLVAAGVVLGLAPTSRADRIILRGGGELRGVIVADAERPDKVLVQAEKSPAPTVFEKGQVAKVIRVAGPLDSYFGRRDAAEPTATAQHELGLWCEQYGLTGLADLHFKKAVAADKDFAPAHRKLGHGLYQGQWLTTDEIRLAQGLTKVKGKWVTPEEKARRDSQAAFSAEQVSWVKRLRITRMAYYSERQEDRDRAEAELLDIRDPAAAAPLALIFGQDAATTRTLMVQAIGNIPGPEASNVLIDLILADPENGPRQAAIGELIRREANAEASVRLVKALKSQDQTYVGRAAWGLAGLNATSAVPKLIPKLVQVRVRTVMVPTEGGGGGGGSAFFGGGRTFGFPIPAVGNGVVAMGAVGVPVFGGVGVSSGGGGGGPVMQPRMIQEAVPNEAVRGALVQLTGVDFGYDVDTWRQWSRTEFRAEPVVPRRVPQP